jgi:hypothetical protein
MQYMVIGMFGRYADAEAAVLDLESAGIVGEQVETISEKLYYMQVNPVHRGVPADPKDCPCSSFSFRSKSTQALIRIVPARQKNRPLGNPPPKTPRELHPDNQPRLVPNLTSDTSRRT